MKYYLVVNPHGGKNRGPGILKKVQPIFKEAGAEVTVIETERAGHARELAKTVTTDGYNGFCAIGGDGTMHEVVNGMMSRSDGQRLPIGLITGGTGNSLMHDLDCLDPEIAVKRILTNRKRAMDIARIDANGEIFYAFNIVGWGLPTDINILADKILWTGTQRYNIASIIEVLKHNQRLAKLIIDGNIVIGDYGFILGCNTIHTGVGMKMAPMAQISDGLIDLIIVKKASRFKLLRMFPKVFSGGHIGDHIVEYRQVREFSVLPMVDHVLNIDGELLGSTPIHVKMLPSAIDILV